MRQGDVLGDRYELEKLIGHGSMGAVWRATDMRLQRTVAIKVLHPSVIDDAESRARFEREAHNLAVLRHEGIVRVHDYHAGDEDEANQCYLVMEYIPGESLYARLQRTGTLDAPSALSIVAQVASGLAAAHREEIVHRDIKPGNVVVSDDGTVTLVDFGIAQRPSESRLTGTGCMGTEGYVAPECTAGGAPSSASDVYSLAVLAVVCLTGERPRSDTTRESVGGRLLAVGVPNPVVDIIVAGLSADPAMRPTTASIAEILEPPGRPVHAIRALEPSVPLGNAAAVAAPSSLDGRGGRRRRTLLLISATVSVMVLALGGVAIASDGWRLTGEEADTVPTDAASQSRVDAAELVPGSESPSESPSAPDASVSGEEDDAEQEETEPPESEPLTGFGKHELRYFLNRATGQCLHASESGAVTTVSPCNGTDNHQRWRAYPNVLYQNVATGQCLAADEGGGVFMADCDEVDRQKWSSWVDATRMHNNESGQCLRGNHNGVVRTAKCSEVSDYYIWERHSAETGLHGGARI